MGPFVAGAIPARGTGAAGVVPVVAGRAAEIFPEAEPSISTLSITMEDGAAFPEPVRATRIPEVKNTVRKLAFIQPTIRILRLKSRVKLTGNRL